MADIFDVSKALLTHYPYGVSTRKLQKLTYLAQGWCLAIADRPLFDEDFEAWRFGPVCPQLFAHHQGMYSITEPTLSIGSACALTKAERTLVDTVAEEYWMYSGDALSDMTHEAGSPWQKARARAGVPADAPSNEIIRKDDMRLFFKDRLGL